MSRWAEAQEVFIAAKARSSVHTARAYQRALEDLQAFVEPLSLDEIGGAEAEAWANDLVERGLSPATINARLSAVSSFYTWAMQSFTDAQGQGLATFNPISVVERPSVQPFGKSRALTIDQARDLLAAIDRSTVIGARDFAMILMGLYCGRRSAEIRGLTWSDVEFYAEEHVRYRWNGKGKARWDTLPPPVYDAITIYLEQAGRRESIRPGDHVFISHSVNGDGELSSQWFNARVQSYASEAGLPEWVTAHTLRHTASELRDEAGEDLWGIGQLLGHSSPETTRVYRNEMAGYEDESWPRVQQLLEGGQGRSLLLDIDDALVDLQGLDPETYECYERAHSVIKAVQAGELSLSALMGGDE
jgi:site-specific recombinase XerD